MKKIKCNSIGLVLAVMLFFIFTSCKKDENTIGPTEKYYGLLKENYSTFDNNGPHYETDSMVTFVTVKHLNDQIETEQDTVDVSFSQLLSEFNYDTSRISFFFYTGNSDSAIYQYWFGSLIKFKNPERIKMEYSETLSASTSVSYSFDGRKQ